MVENNHYFPPDSIIQEFFVDRNTYTTCPWKGEASYKSINVHGEINKDAAWHYPGPKDAAKEIQGYFAFWKGVKIKE